MQGKIALVLFLTIISSSVIAQARITNETKLTLVVNEENDKIIDLELFDETHVENIKKRYPDSKLFIGLLQGSYEIEKKRVKPNSGATITIYTERQFFPNEKFFPKKGLTEGDNLIIGSIKAKITSKKKGELVLTAQ